MPDLYNLIQHPDRALARTEFSGNKKEKTYPEHRNASHNAGILRRGQGVVRGGEIALWLRTAGIGFLDLDTLLFWCHFWDGKMSSAVLGRLGCELIGVDYCIVHQLQLFSGRETIMP
jgi:hypothetical protein